MKKISIILLLFLARLIPAQAEENMTFFNGSFIEALEKAKSQQKLLFIDCFTTWCGPCKKMSSQVFTNNEVYNYFNKNFICYALDMEKGEGIDIAKKYSVKNYPTFLWLDGTGKQIHRSVGSAEASVFLTTASNALNPKGNLSYLKQKYESGNREPDLMLSYAHELKTAYDMNYQLIADEYFRSQPINELASEKNWKTILEFTPNIDSYIYKSITKSPQRFNEHFGKDSVQEVLDELALQTLYYAKQQKDSTLLGKAIAQLKKSNNRNIFMEAAKGELDFYKSEKNMLKYTALAREYIEKYFINDPTTLNAICWTYFMQVNEKEKLANAEKWIAASVALDDQYYNTDTYANILHKLGKKKEAIAMTKHSIELAKKSSEDYSSTQSLLDELLKGE